MNTSKIIVDFSKQKQLDADLKAIQQVGVVVQLKNLVGVNAGGVQSMLVLPILEKIKESRLKFSQGSVTVLWKMVNYEKARVKLTNMQLDKLKSAA